MGSLCRQYLKHVKYTASLSESTNKTQVNATTLRFSHEEGVSQAARHVLVKKVRFRLFGTCSSSRAWTDERKGNVTWNR